MSGISALKFVGSSSTRISGLAAPYYGPFRGGKDIQGERFVPSTDFGFAGGWPQILPVLYHHGQRKGDGPGVQVIGHTVRFEDTPEGLWCEAELDEATRYLESVKRMIRAGKAFFSTGALSHLVSKKADGTITSWRIGELSITPTPAHPGATISLDEASKSFKAAGLDIESIRALAESADTTGGFAVPDDEDEKVAGRLSAAQRDALPDSSFGYISPDGKRHLPLDTPGRIRSALGRFHQTTFHSAAARASAKRKILAAATAFGIEVSPDWAKSGLSWLRAEISAAEAASGWVDYCSQLCEFFEGLNSRRVKEARSLSTSTLRELAEVIDAGRELLDRLAQLKMRGDPATESMLARLDMLRLFEATLPHEMSPRSQIDSLRHFSATRSG